MGTGQEKNHHWEKRAVFDSVVEHDGGHFWCHLSMEVPVSRRHWIQTRAKKWKTVTFAGGLIGHRLLGWDFGCPIAFPTEIPVQMEDRSSVGLVFF